MTTVRDVLPMPERSWMSATLVRGERMVFLREGIRRNDTAFQRGFQRFWRLNAARRRALPAGHPVLQARNEGVSLPGKARSVAANSWKW
jgi:hypothetical protein